MLRREVAIDALAPNLGVVTFDYLNILRDVLKCSILMIIGLRRTGMTRAIFECTYAIIKRAEDAFLGVNALYPSMASS